MLGASPVRYVREWRLCLASVALSTTEQPIAAIAHEAGYGTEAAFNRAFSRAYGLPPPPGARSRAGWAEAYGPVPPLAHAMKKSSACSLASLEMWPKRCVTKTCFGSK